MKILREYIRETINGETQPEIQPTSIIYCDMDGVLVNFEAGTIELINTLIAGEEVPAIEPDNRFLRFLDRVKDELGDDFVVASRTDLDLKPVRKFMFYVISKDPGGFFGSLPPMTDGVDQLWPYLATSGHQLSILSAPVQGRKDAPGGTAEEGKTRWVQAHLSPQPSDIIIVPAVQKPEYATTNGVPNILVDDKVSTIRAWNQEGGLGILHTPGDSGSSITRLRELGL